METIVKLSEEEAKEIAKKEWNDERMQEYLIRTYDFYKTKDGLIFEVTKASKLSINTTIWYDDELPKDEIPSASYANFILENRHNCNIYECYKEQIEKNKTLYFCKDNNLVYIDYQYGLRDVCNIVREITKDEALDILEVFEKQREDYGKRLDRYYKRYSKHIRCQGYWRNR